MKQVRSAALSRYSAPDFILLAGLELMQLRKLPPLAFRLFIELLAMADHITGRISTSYAVLEALCDFDAPPGTHAPDRATQKRLRTAIVALVDLRLIVVDRRRNESAKGLFFTVPSRLGLSASDGRKGRRKGRPENAEKPLKQGLKSKIELEEGQTEGQGVQEENSFSLSPYLSTGDDPETAREKLKRTAREIKARRNGGTLQ